MFFLSRSFFKTETFCQSVQLTLLKFFFFVIDTAATCPNDPEFPKKWLNLVAFDFNPRLKYFFKKSSGDQTINKLLVKYIGSTYQYMNM